MSAFGSGGVPAGVASSGVGIAGFAKLCGWASVASVYGSLAIIAILALDGKHCRAGHKVALQRRAGGKVEVVRFTSSETFELGTLVLPAGTTVARAGVIELAQDALLDGIPCQAGAPVELYKDRVRAATLARDFRRSRITWKAGTRFRFRSTGNLSGTVALDVERRGVRYPAGTELQLLEGRVVRAKFRSDAVIDGIPCLAEAELILDAGRVRTCTLAARHRFGTQTFERGITIVIDRDGRARAVSDVAPASHRQVLGRAKKIRGIRFPPGTELEPQPYADPGDADLSVVLRAPQTIHGVECPSGTKLDLHAWGVIKLLVDADREVHRVVFRAGTTLELHRRFGLAGAARRLQEKDADAPRQTLQGIELGEFEAEFYASRKLRTLSSRKPFVAGSLLCAGHPHAVGLHANGSIACAVLAEPTEIAGVRYAEFTALELDREGRMTRAFEPVGR